MRGALSSTTAASQLAWVAFSDEQLLQGLLQNGFTEQMASVYVIEIGVALKKGILFDDYRENKHKASGNINLTDFAGEFAAVYKSS